MPPLGSKVLIPAMLMLTGILFATSSTTRPLGVVLSGVIILLGVTQFVVVGLVNPTEECLFYRRFLTWRRIEYSDIVKCGRPIFPLFWGLQHLNFASLSLRWEGCILSNTIQHAPFPSTNLITR